MRAVVQIVDNATLSVDNNVVSSINKGFLVFVGVKTTDTDADLEYIKSKLLKLRIFPDSDGKTNLSLFDIKGEILLVSNFTLYGDVKGSNRPSFINAARPDISKPLYEKLAKQLNEQIPTKTGIFGADMIINLQANGPFTLLFDSEKTI